MIEQRRALNQMMFSHSAQPDDEEVRILECAARMNIELTSGVRRSLPERGAVQLRVGQLEAEGQWLAGQRGQVAAAAEGDRVPQRVAGEGI
jgi:hypothetical protein